MAFTLRSLPRFLLPAAALAAVAASAQQAPGHDDLAETQRALAQARAEGRAARGRAETLEAAAARTAAAADRTAQEAAAIAARIQQTEAEIAGREAEARLIALEQAALRTRLAGRQQPLVRLTAALQRLSRRPPVLALLRPGSVRDTMYMRALFATMLPEVQRRTAALRAEIARSRALQHRAELAARGLRESEAQLTARRRALATLEMRQRLDSRQVTGEADREAERALALAERAQDLDALTGELRRAGALRETLALLPGPVMRPARPEDAEVIPMETRQPAPAGPASYMLPVAGRLVSGFGDRLTAGPRVRGIALATRPGAQIVAPAPGRVAFAGPYRGYGTIVIIEHPGGWTSLVTGLARLDTGIGAQLVTGSPLGVAASGQSGGPGQAVITLELRRGGEPVDPLAFVRPQ
ncbi:MAG: peptidoglycan DD-metalloendopeptidase family protein [Novosphingobium sp.]|jgi:septal ring factor EnvC (AmiA/AmiB activator)|nr:peptidoglycan DD-metalloendopeptidase family protein [Novosphingobium sp.]